MGASSLSSPHHLIMTVAARIARIELNRCAVARNRGMRSVTEESHSERLVVPNRTNVSRTTSESGRSGSSDASVPWPSDLRWAATQAAAAGTSECIQCGDQPHRISY
jgi:hypothetical protein